MYGRLTLVFLFACGCGGAVEPLAEPLDAALIVEASPEETESPVELDASEEVDAGRRYGCVGSEAGCPDRIDHPPCIHVDGMALHCDAGED
jgi:hypothetical protein